MTLLNKWIVMKKLDTNHNNEKNKIRLYFTRKRLANLYIKRHLEEEVLKASKYYPVVMVCGQR